MKHHLVRTAARIAMARPLAARIGRAHLRGPGAALDPQIAALLALQRLGRYPRLETLPPPAARRFAIDAFTPMELPPARMVSVVDGGVPGPAGRIAVRRYTPHGAGPHQLVWLHGGGGVIGSIAAYDRIARGIAARTRCAVVSVEYRLGPEHRHPAAIEDACAAWDALAAQAPAGARLAVGGDSFGGFLASHVERHARGAGRRRADAQLLVYPAADMTLTSPSIARLGEGYLLTQAMMTWFRDLYFHPEDDRAAPSPARWGDHAGAAPAIVVTAGYDPLVDDGDALAARLAAAGVAVRHLRHPSLVHGFLSLAGVVTAARAAFDAMCAEVVAVLAS